jgi:hypothetical protein
MTLKEHHPNSLFYSNIPPASLPAALKLRATTVQYYERRKATVLVIIASVIFTGLAGIQNVDEKASAYAVRSDYDPDYLICIFLLL